jgi:hypothetical protein
MKRTRRWLAGLLIAVLVFVTMEIVLDRVVASHRAQKYLTARLEQAFGRTVEVSYFDLRWFPIPAITAHSVTIGEDPRFGREYFLRADSVTAGLRWRGLFTGRLELGTVELSQPSLNLVRNPDGLWNVGSWLPPPGSSAPKTSGAKATRVGGQLSKIEIDGGRVNFSRGLDRRPFALVELAGSIEQESHGRWKIDLSAQPARAIVHLQETGILHVTGEIAGTSARLNPADLTVTWNGVSVADAFRLALGNDPGVRGNLALQLTAHSESAPDGAAAAPARWDLSLSGRVEGLHRWDMASRSDNPSLSVRAEGAWVSGASQMNVRQLLVEAPNSSVAGAGAVDWSDGINPDLHMNSFGVAFADLFAWYRAFQPGVSDAMAADGFLKGNSDIKGWPAKVGAGEVTSEGVAFNLSGVRLIKSAPIHARFDSRGAIDLSPVIWTIEPIASPESESAAEAPRTKGASDTLKLDARLFPADNGSAKKPVTPRWAYEIGLSGEFAHMERFLAVARAFGRQFNIGWDAEGGLSGELRWLGNLHEQFPKPSGAITPHELALKLPLLNRPIELENARVDLGGRDRRVTISSAEALGAHWQGIITRRDGPSPWEFDLVADHLDAAELDRWLGPRARPGWIARLFTPQKPGVPAQIPTSGALAMVRAHGTISVETFALTPLVAQKVHAQVDLRGRTVNITQFDAKVDGGSVAGSLLASLESDPNYRLDATITNVSAAELAASSAELRGRVSGQMTGELRLTMHGVGRENLLDSIKGAGRVSLANGAIRDLDLSGAETATPHDEAKGQFSLLSAGFSVDVREIHLEKILLQDDKETLEGVGTADFTRAMRIELWPRPQALGAKPVSAGPSGRVFRVTGSLESPHVFLGQASIGALQTPQAPGH